MISRLHLQKLKVSREKREDEEVEGRNKGGGRGLSVLPPFAQDLCLKFRTKLENMF
jgi:hypothetical protein